MDLLRVCHTARMRFFHDDPLEIPVRWYFSETGPLYGKETVFGSSTWSSRFASIGGLGEVEDSLEYANGTPPPFPGPNLEDNTTHLPIGTPEQFLIGSSINDPSAGGIDDGTCPNCVKPQENLTCPELLPYAGQIWTAKILAVHKPDIPQMGKVGATLRFNTYHSLVTTDQPDAYTPFLGIDRTMMNWCLICDVDGFSLAVTYLGFPFAFTEKIPLFRSNPVGSPNLVCRAYDPFSARIMLSWLGTVGFQDRDEYWLWELTSSSP